VEPFVTPQGIDPQAKQIIQHKARRLIGKAGFTPSDLPDIEQEMLFKLSRSQAAYDPKRAKPSTFVKTVAERQGMNLVRKQQSRGRSKVQLHSLEGRALAGLAGRTSSQALLDLQLDVQEKVSQLSQSDQDLCKCLMHMTFSQTARAMSVPRSTLQDMVRRMGHRLVELGMESYAPFRPLIEHKAG
jgi:DNA-directed RNA polymerase specialized sigma24 family protein